MEPDYLANIDAQIREIQEQIEMGAGVEPDAILNALLAIREMLAAKLS